MFPLCFLLTCECCQLPCARSLPCLPGKCHVQNPTHLYWEDQPTSDQ
jgi:hypothetical protein